MSDNENETPTMPNMFLQMLGIGPDFSEQVKTFVTAFAEMKATIERCEQRLEKIDYMLVQLNEPAPLVSEVWTDSQR